MDFLEWLALASLLAGIWFWLDTLKAREAGVLAARQACDREGWLLLDDTVAGRSLGLARDDDGQLRLRRVYAFEFSDTGDNRRTGSITLLGQEVELLSLGAPTRPSLYVIRNDNETLH